ncbi:nucleoside deaminase [Mycetocola zhadangensis]|uniref:Nucleoside deaminase n=1 Tax=Mycetocola zhadangensis TaxID=1164595 RepID=A0A3L7J1A1_9MICO|nr:nucleoside deaminase [Mycetocola zhadangensis]RLQ84169.1 nucleoside deaminase [Mycetocola zhadangensis]GGE95500.1 tRNA-specific adenosine deaminase [Mycetocola zhadangensis]
MSVSGDPAASAHLNHAIALAVENVAGGGGPFGAVIVTGDGRVFGGANRVTADNDPTAHAEVVAIRHACAELGTFDLTGSTLYASCEPCPLCVAASLWAHVDAVVYAADRHDADRAGFDDKRFYDHFDGIAPAITITLSAADEPLAPFAAWADNPARTEY